MLAMSVCLCLNGKQCKNYEMQKVRCVKENTYIVILSSKNFMNKTLHSLIYSYYQIHRYLYVAFIKNTIKP